MKHFPFLVAAMFLALFASAGAQTPAAPAGTSMPTLTLAAPSPAAPVVDNRTTLKPLNPATVVLQPEPAEPAEAFSAGLAAYAAGNYPKARGHFLTAENKAVSAPLEYNFGNACYQAGDYGAAVLHYLRALSLNPRDPDTRQNLALARTAANLTLPEPPWLDCLSGVLTRNAWTWLAALTGWATLYLALVPALYRWRGAAPWLVCAVMGGATLLSGLGAWGAQRHAHDGVVQRADTPLKLSPTAGSTALGTIQAGEVALTIDEHNGFFKILSPDGHTGWVDRESYTPVWNQRR